MKKISFLPPLIAILASFSSYAFQSNIENGANLIQNVSERNKTTLDGLWNIIIDPMENGFYNHRWQEKDNGFFQNSWYD